MNIIDCVLTVLIAVALVFAIRKTIQNHKQGNNCTGNCLKCYKNCNKELRN